MEQRPDPRTHYVSTWGRRKRRPRAEALEPAPEASEEWPLSEKVIASLESRAAEWPASDEWVMPPDPIELTPPDAWEHNPT